MFATERQSKIVEFIRNRGSVQVEELAQELNVSAMTIRRDLVKLQEEDMIERCHGGAVAKQEVTYEDKQTTNKSIKEKIAKACLPVLENINTVYLDAGTTTYEIAKLIKDRTDILIVTNDLEIARLLKDGVAELYVCGGRVQKSTGSMFDSYARQMVKDFKFDIGFFGAASINDELEVMTPTIEKMWLKRQMPTQCGKSYLVVDHSKFGKQAMSKINDLGDYTGVVTDREFSKDEEEKIKKIKVNVIKA